jgi:hypothetical protein
MEIIDSATQRALAILAPFLIAGLGVCVAVFGKAYRKFPFQPDEWKAFHWPILPRMHSKIYVVEKKSRPPGAREAGSSPE